MPTPNPPDRSISMKRELTIVSILAAIGSFMLTGCVNLKGTGSNTDTVQQAAQVANVAYAVVKVGTAGTLIAKPEYRPAFEVAVQSLDALLAADKADLAEMNKILANIGVDELQSEQGVLVMQGGVALFQLATAAWWEPDSRAGTMLFIQRVRDGMAEALGKPAGTITPASIATPARLESNTRTF